MAGQGPKPGSLASLNGLKNGKRLSKRLVIGELPQQLISVKREGRAYRRELESCVLAAKSEISLTDAHLIDTASACTIQAGICRWLLRERLDKMTVAEILACSQNQVKTKQARDAAVRALGLDAEPQAPWLIDVKPLALITDDADEEHDAADDIDAGGHDLHDK